MSSTKVLGKNAMLYVFDVPTDDYQPFVCARDITQNIATEFIETSVSGSGQFRTFVPTANTGAVTIRGLMALNKDVQLDIADFQRLQLAREKLDSYIIYEAENGRTYTLSCDLYVENTSVEASFDNVSNFSVDLRMTGEITLTEAS